MREKIFHAACQESNIIGIQLRADDICRMRANRAAHVNDTADHADAGTFTENRFKLLTVITADNSLAAAHEFKGERTDILQDPEFRFFIQRIVLHQRACTRTTASADEDLATGRTMSRRITSIATYRNDTPGVEPAHVCRRRFLDDDFRPRQAHGTGTLTSIPNMEMKLLAFRMPERAADVVLAGSLDLKVRLALLDASPMARSRSWVDMRSCPFMVSILNIKLSSCYQQTYWIPSLSATALSVETSASLRPIGSELLPIGAMSFLSSASKAST